VVIFPSGIPIKIPYALIFSPCVLHSLPISSTKPKKQITKHRVRVREDTQVALHDRLLTNCLARYSTLKTEVCVPPKCRSNPTSHSIRIRSNLKFRVTVEAVMAAVFQHPAPLDMLQTRTQPSVWATRHVSTSQGPSSGVYVTARELFRCGHTDHALRTKLWRLA
jgi:hypothetical protein